MTPAAGAGQFDNRLDPLLRLYDSQGTLVAEDDNSSGGLNALILFQPQGAASDVYYIEVAAAESQGEGAAGEYLLEVHDAGVVPAVPMAARAAAIDAALAAAVLAAEQPAFFCPSGQHCRPAALPTASAGPRDRRLRG